MPVTLIRISEVSMEKNLPSGSTLYFQKVSDRKKNSYRYFFSFFLRYFYYKVDLAEKFISIDTIGPGNKLRIILSQASQTCNRGMQQVIILAARA